MEILIGTIELKISQQHVVNTNIAAQPELMHMDLQVPTGGIEKNFGEGHLGDLSFHFSL